jgi:hypothetical protein
MPAKSARPAIGCLADLFRTSTSGLRTGRHRATAGGHSVVPAALPDNLRHHYTEGQRAVLCVVALEVKRHGVCDWPIDKIAAIAGVGRTTVQNAMHEARRLGHITITERPRRGSKNLTNIVRISSQEWRTWSTRGPSAARLIGSNPPKMVSTTKIKDLNKKEAGNGKALIPVTRDEGTPLG